MVGPQSNEQSRTFTGHRLPLHKVASAIDHPEERSCDSAKRVTVLGIDTTFNPEFLEINS